MIWAFGQELPIWACLVIDIFIGVVGSYLFDRFYHQGIIHVTEGRGDKPDRYLFEFNIEPESIRGRQFVVFRIVKEREQQNVS